jgi:hypothetical protein
MQDSAQTRASQERVALIKEETERMRLASEEARAHREADRADREEANKGMQPAQPRTFGGNSL